MNGKKQEVGLSKKVEVEVAGKWQHLEDNSHRYLSYLDFCRSGQEESQSFFFFHPVFG